MNKPFHAPIGKISSICGKPISLIGDDIDTDRIIPARFLKCVNFDHLGESVFADDRQILKGEHPFDLACNKGSSILIVNSNFGCGSSREHAAWAIKDFGIKTILAESFADIFYNNCFKNGILPIVLNKDIIKSLFRKCDEDDKFALKIDLDNQIISGSDIEDLSFDIDPYRKKALLKGLDEIGQTLEDIDLISDFEQKHKKTFPWLF